jgi:hypothetical protein
MGAQVNRLTVVILRAIGACIAGIVGAGFVLYDLAHGDTPGAIAHGMLCVFVCVFVSPCDEDTRIVCAILRDTE